MFVECLFNPFHQYFRGGSVAEWLACWTQAQKGRYAALTAVDRLSGTSIDGTDRQMDGRTDGRPIVTQTLHRIFCTQRQ